MRQYVEPEIEFTILDIQDICTASVQWEGNGNATFDDYEFNDDCWF